MDTLILTNAMLFLSTLSLRRATALDISAKREARISIHALLAESDVLAVTSEVSESISIHALLAESDHETYVIMEATKVISIHALLAESDRALL